MVNESYEDYLKAIYLISKSNKGGWVSNSQIAQFFNISPSSVSGMLHKLKKHGFVIWTPGSAIRLTLDGKEIAEQILKNYQVLNKFFTSILKIKDNELVKELCCGIEHHLTPEVANALEEQCHCG